MNLFRHTTSTQQLVERYYQPLYWYVRRMVVGHADTEDILQDTFLQIHSHLSELRQVQAERAWVYRIATNQTLMFLRHKHDYVSLDDDAVAPLLNTLAEEQYIDTSNQLVMLFQQAILTLPTKQRMVFNLRYYDELSYEEIADIVGSSVGSAKTNYHFAKQKISQYVLAHSD